MEIRSLRHRADTAEQVHLLLTENMKVIDKHLENLNGTVYGRNGHPGLNLDVDRLKQRALGASEALQLRITMAAAIVGAIAGPLVAWFLSR